MICKKSPFPTLSFEKNIFDAIKKLTYWEYELTFVSSRKKNIFKMYFHHQKQQNIVSEQKVCFASKVKSSMQAFITKEIK
jgi:hypothetical protein